MPFDPKKILQVRNIIVELFNKNVKGKTSDLALYNIKHDGKEGHWLEQQMGIEPNSRNTPDLDGFEMKNNTKSRTSFGDWSADYYIFKDKSYIFNRNDFLKVFGMPNNLKQGRYSWSGKACPKIGGYNMFGQKIEVDQNNNIMAIYSFSFDQREQKYTLIPKNLQKEELVLARWSEELMKKRVESKFNQYGWFKCIKNKNGIYTNIVFGDPIKFETFIDFVKQGIIFFDSGMYEGNKRPYSQWRANNTLWEKLITYTF